MTEIYEFSLVKPAKSMGGDRYATMHGLNEWTVYFPQEISRVKDGKPATTITIEVKQDDN